ncbi:deaminase domain-containing protein [Streptomyces sp. NPDC001840]
MGDFGKFGKQFQRLMDAWNAARHIRNVDPKDVVNGLRETGRFKKTMNVAAATVDVDGIDPMVLAATSGFERRQGMVPSPGDPVSGYPQRYIPVSRAADSEAKIFNYLANRIGPPSDLAGGTIRMHTQREMCSSCGGVMESFRRDYPNINVVVTWG